MEDIEAAVVDWQVDPCGTEPVTLGDGQASLCDVVDDAEVAARRALILIGINQVFQAHHRRHRRLGCRNQGLKEMWLRVLSIVALAEDRSAPLAHRSDGAFSADDLEVP